MKRFVYADNAATTPVSQTVLNAMLPYYTEKYGNPSSLYAVGREAKKALEEARANVANHLGALPNEIFFTSGGSEADNWAIKGIAYELAKKGKKHIITSKFEHHAVLHTTEALEKEGFEVTYLPVGKDGKISLENLKNAIKKETILVSVMHVNNEIGTIQPIEEIGKYLKSLDEKVYFHVDGVQSYAKIKFRPSRYNIDFMSVSGHKLHGPKGIGFMYVKENNRIKPLLTGGGQEIGIRSGTENVPGIYGIGEAVRILNQDLEGTIDKIRGLRDLLKEEILANIDNVKINSPEDGVCHVLNVSFRGVRGEVLLHYLEQKEIYVSTGSACSSKKKGSHVLNAIGLTPDEIEGAIRFSLSDLNTKEEIMQTVEVLKESVSDLRMIIGRRR